MCDNESFGFALGGLSKIYAIRIMARGNDEFLAFNKMFFHLLSKHVEDAYPAQVFALDGKVFVGWIRSKAERQGVFVDTV